MLRLTLSAECQGGGPTHTVTGKILLAAVMVMQVLNTTCSQWPCSTQSSEFQDKGRVNVMFISSWASRPTRRNTREQNRLLENKQARAETCTAALNHLKRETSSASNPSCSRQPGRAPPPQDDGSHGVSSLTRCLYSLVTGLIHYRM